MNRVLLAASILLALTMTPAAPPEPALLLQKPTLSRTNIVFAYAGDLWIVAREGGGAKQLTTGVGIESNPVFSPDGSLIAFTGQYDGNTDVYTVPATGGVPKRLTFHPDADDVVGWTRDGKQVLFRSRRHSYANFSRLLTLSLEGGLPTEVPLPMADDASYSPDGKRMAYQPLTRWQADWKRYRGGQTAPIWIANLADSSIEKLPRDNSNDTHPMWIEDKIYFLSDRNGPASLFSYDPATKKVTQVVQNRGLDIKSASAGPGAIVYEQFGAIHLFDLKSAKSQQVNISVVADLASVRPRYERVNTRISTARLSPTGARAVFEARGEILTVPVEKGDARNLTNTPGVMERDPAWSPDGKWIAHFSDESGEYGLQVREQSGMGEVKKIALGQPPSFYYRPTWSPDSKKIAYTDKQLNLWYLEFDKGTPIKVDTNPEGIRNQVMTPIWSPDSRWVAYTKQLENHLRAVFVYSLEKKTTHQLTDGMSDARHAAFDKSGKYLYFTASTNLGPTVSPEGMSNFPHQSSRSVYAIVLRNDLPSPLAPESDEEKVTESSKPAENAGEKKADGQPAPTEGAKPAEGQKPAETPKPAPKKDAEPLRFDFDDISQRIVALPIPARNFVGLNAGKANTIFLLESLPAGALGTINAPGVTLHKYDLEKRKLDKALDGIGSFDISSNGEKILYNQGPNWIIASTATLGTVPPRPGEGVLRVAEMEVYVDPKAEWKQMYHEIWRSERDFFYDPEMHGLDLKAAEKLYEPYLEGIAHRSDLNYLFREMLNQLTVSHMYINGGDQPRPNFVPGGLLGCDYVIENGRYRLAKVYNGESWNPQLRAPLTQPGVNVKAGEYLLAVAGREVRASDSVYSFFESKSGKQVVIRVGPNADGSSSREVTVVPMANEAALRNLAWIEGNRRKVDQMSGGKLAYVYVPDTGIGGYTNFNRYFFAQTQKAGAVIDERFNGGGAIADYIVDYLTRPLLSYIVYRDKPDQPAPLAAIHGPKAMLINELAGSGGDVLPWYFRKAKAGTLIGKRTWGGGTAAARAPQLMDGGSVTTPAVPLYGTDGKWDVENYGVAPDIEIEFDPAAWRAGRDPQLEKAIEVLLAELKKHPPKPTPRPAFPNYHNGGKSVVGGNGTGGKK